MVSERLLRKQQKQRLIVSVGIGKRANWKKLIYLWWCILARSESLCFVLDGRNEAIIMGTDKIGQLYHLVIIEQHYHNLIAMPQDNIILRTVRNCDFTTILQSYLGWYRRHLMIRQSNGEHGWWRLYWIYISIHCLPRNPQHGRLCFVLIFSKTLHDLYPSKAFLRIRFTSALFTSAVHLDR